MIKKLNIKLILLFFLIMVLSFILSFPITLLFSNTSMKNELQLSQKSIAQAILELSEQTELSIDEIIHLTSSLLYSIQEVQELPSHISSEAFHDIKPYQSVFLPRLLTTVLKLDDSYIVIALNPQNNMLQNALTRIHSSILVFILIGCLLSILMFKRMIRPIGDLTSATQKVAKGNFDVHVENNSPDEIGQLARNFNLMVQELKDIDYLRKDFISSVSHEFKTPLASIEGFAKLLQMPTLSQEEREEYTEIIIEEASRLSRLSTNILKLSKLENQKFVYNTSTFSLDEQIRKCVLLLEYEWSKKNINLHIELEPTPFTGDEELLQQVWLNLVGNAIKFSSENSSICIILYATDTLLKVKISDTGIGMDEKIIKRIFEKFYQGDKSHSYSGNGLGLSLVKKILDLCNGTVSVESTPGVGATFTVSLPR